MLPAWHLSRPIRSNPESSISGPKKDLPGNLFSKLMSNPHAREKGTARICISYRIYLIYFEIGRWRGAGLINNFVLIIHFTYIIVILLGELLVVSDLFVDDVGPLLYGYFWFFEAERQEPIFVPENPCFM
jgi:hypothetical protein